MSENRDRPPSTSRPVTATDQEYARAPSAEAPLRDSSRATNFLAELERVKRGEEQRKEKQDSTIRKRPPPQDADVQPDSGRHDVRTSDEGASWRRNAAHYFATVYEVVDNPDRFFARLDASGLPIVMFVGSHAAGKSTLLEALAAQQPGSSDVRDVYDAANRSFERALRACNAIDQGQALPRGGLRVEASRRGTRRKRPFRRPLACPAFRDTDARFERLPTEGPISKREFEPWKKNTGGLLRCADNLGLYGRMPTVGGYRELLHVTTQFFVAHFLRLQGEELVLLDVPGESAREDERKRTRDVLLRWVPHLVSAVILVEPFDALYCERDSALRARVKRFDGRAWQKRELSILDFAKNELERDATADASRVNQSAWEGIFRPIAEASRSLPVPFLHVLTKFDALDDLYEFELFGPSNHPNHTRWQHWNGGLKDFVATVQAPRPRSGEEERYLEDLAAAAEQLLHNATSAFPYMNQQCRLWSVFEDWGTGAGGYARHRFLPTLPTCCRLPGNRGSADGEPRAHGVRLVLMWLYLQTRTFRRLAG